MSAPNAITRLRAASWLNSFATATESGVLRIDPTLSPERIAKIDREMKSFREGQLPRILASFGLSTGIYATWHLTRWNTDPPLDDGAGGYPLAQLLQEQKNVQYGLKCLADAIALLGSLEDGEVVESLAIKLLIAQSLLSQSAWSDETSLQ